MTTTTHFVEADLLRPFTDHFAGRSVLQIGDDVALTQFIRDCGATVNTVELPFGDIEPAAQYDLVTFIGPVVELSLPLIREAAGLLKPDGALLIAMDNIQGKKELTCLLRKAGCAVHEFYFPFPDYRQPAVILREEALTEPGLDLVNLIQPYTVDARSKVRALLADGLLGELADSIIVVAGPHTIPGPDGSILGWSFNSGRKPPYNKTNLFLRTPGKGLSVKRIGHSPDTQPSSDAAVVQCLHEEPYIPGRLYSLQLADRLCSPGWSLEDLQEWAEPYYRLLQQLALPVGGRDHLDGAYVDLAPFNLLSGEDGELGVIDLEWSAREPIPLEYLFFRGIYHSLARIQKARLPKPGTPVNAFGLTLGILERFLPDTSGVLEDFVEREERYFGPILSGAGATPADFDVPVTTTAGKSQLPADGTPLHPLLALNLQIFIRTETQEFNEESSSKHRIGLTRERKIYSLPLKEFPAGAIHLRIDPSDHPGFLCLHAANLRSPAGEELLYWTPFSRSDVSLNGVIILQAAPSLPEPVTILVNSDPMIIFPLPDAIRLRPCGLLLLELELSAPDGPLTDTVLTTLQAIK